jgi:hypothetical protein
MRQEHVTLHNVEVSQLYDKIRKYVKDQKLDIIREEKEENYWDLKAHKGTLLLYPATTADWLTGTSTPSACKTHKWKKTNEPYSCCHSNNTEFESCYFEH